MGDVAVKGWAVGVCGDVAYVWCSFGGCQGSEAVVGGWVGAWRW